MSFKICTVGCGPMAVNGHGPAYKEYARRNKDTVLAACCDIKEEKAAEFRGKFGFARYYTSMDEMLAKEQPDAVCLVVPVSLTAQLAVKVMEQGYPVLMEKPPGMNREEAARIIEAARKSGMANQVSFNRRYMPLIIKAKELLSADTGSGIQNIRCDFYRVGRRDPDFSTTAIHGIDTVKFLAGSEYEYVRFHYQEMPEYGPGVANIFMDCTFESGATAQLAFCPLAGTVCEHITVNTLNNSYLLKIAVAGSVDFPGKIIRLAENKTAFEIDGGELSDSTEMYVSSGFYNENTSFFDDIKVGRKPHGDVESALQSVEIADCIRRRMTEYSSDRC